MPIKHHYDKKLKKWVVENMDTHHIFGEHSNEESALAQMRAMAANGVDMEGKGLTNSEKKK